MDPIPQDVSDFMRANIGSLEQLELLRVLGEDPKKEWDLAPLAREVQSDPQAVSVHLTALAARGLLTVVTRGGEISYRHGHAAPHLEKKAARMLQLYKERPVTMIKLVYAHASDPLRAFAEAFRLRKGD